MVYNYPCHLCRGNIKNPALFETKWVPIVALKEILSHSFMVFHRLKNSFQVFTLYRWLIINFIPQYIVTYMCIYIYIYIYIYTHIYKKLYAFAHPHMYTFWKCY